jgi:SAM-dependent methyltransferase
VTIHRSASAFDQAADLYEQVRPGYPVPAVQRLAEDLGMGPGCRVLDLAAGTGKLTRDLVLGGSEVAAVEPVAGMRRTLVAASRSVGAPSPAVVGAVAEALPFGTGRLDAVTVGQGFHWFATRRAVGEIHRVLRPGGGLGLIWNRRDSTDPLQAAMTALMEPLRGDTPSYTTGQWRAVLEAGDLFVATDEFHLPWRQPVEVDEVADRFASVSFVAALPQDERDRLLGEMRVVAAGMPPPLTLVYVTDVFVFQRVDRRVG